LSGLSGGEGAYSIAAAKTQGAFTIINKINAINAFDGVMAGFSRANWWACSRSLPTIAWERSLHSSPARVHTGLKIERIGR
jgi:hypothetical protein